MNTSKATAGVLVGFVAATSFALPSLANPAGTVISGDRTVLLSQAAERQILQRAEVILAKAKGPGGGTVCKPGSPGFDQTCSKTSCVNDCGPAFAQTKKAY